MFYQKQWLRRREVKEVQRLKDLVWKEFRGRGEGRVKFNLKVAGEVVWEDVEVRNMWRLPWGFKLELFQGDQFIGTAFVYFE